MIKDYRLHTLTSIWNDGNKIIGNDSHGVSINCELLYSLGTGIDEPKSVLLSRCELESRWHKVLIIAWSGVAGSLSRAIEKSFSLDEITIRCDELLIVRESLPSCVKTQETTYNSSNISGDNILNE